MRRKLTALAFDMQTPGASSQLHALCIWEWRSMFGGWRTPGHRVDEKFQVGPPSNATGDGVGFSFEAANSTCIGEYPARQTCYPRRFHKQSWSSGVEFRFFRCVVTFNRQHGLFHCSEGREWIPCPVVSAALAPELSCWSEAKERSWSPELSFVRPSIWVDTSILLILYLERTWLLKNVYPCCWWYCDEYQKLRDLFFLLNLYLENWGGHAQACNIKQSRRMFKDGLRYWLRFPFEGTTCIAVRSLPFAIGQLDTWIPYEGISGNWNGWLIFTNFSVAHEYDFFIFNIVQLAYCVEM